MPDRRVIRGICDTAIVGAFAMPGADGDRLPERIHVVPIGRYWDVRRNVPIELTHDLVAALKSRFDGDGVELFADFDHATIYKGESEAAIWFDRLDLAADGLWAHVREYTPRGRAALADRTYKYISPVILWDTPDRRTGERGPALFNVALTNAPNLVDISPLVASWSGGAHDQPQKDGAMKQKLLAVLKSVFGVQIAEDADEAAVLSAVETLKDRVPGDLGLGATVADARPTLDDMRSPKIPRELAVALGGETITVADAVTRVMTLTTQAPDKATIASMQTEIATLKRERQEGEIDAAIAAGKITPADRGRFVSWLSSHPEDCRAFIGSLAPSGPAAPKLPGAEAPSGDLTETDMTVASQLAISREAMKAQKKGVK